LCFPRLFRVLRKPPPTGKGGSVVREVSFSLPGNIHCTSFTLLLGLWTPQTLQELACSQVLHAPPSPQAPLSLRRREVGGWGVIVISFRVVFSSFPSSSCSLSLPRPCRFTPRGFVGNLGCIHMPFCLAHLYRARIDGGSVVMVWCSDICGCLLWVRTSGAPNF